MTTRIIGISENRVSNKRLLIILSTITVLLLIPFIAMQFTKDVNWQVYDFVVMGVLLLGTGLALEFVLRKITSIRYRIMLAIFILFICFLVWVELAVGLFGTPFGGS